MHICFTVNHKICITFHIIWSRLHSFMNWCRDVGKFHTACFFHWEFKYLSRQLRLVSKKSVHSRYFYIHLFWPISSLWKMFNAFFARNCQLYTHFHYKNEGKLVKKISSLNWKKTNTKAINRLECNSIGFSIHTHHTFEMIEAMRVM